MRRCAIGLGTVVESITAAVIAATLYGAPSVETMSASTARRVALAAQGFAGRRPVGVIDRRHGRKVFAHIGLIQIDSVNVVVRSQELPLFARLGSHRRDLLPSMVAGGELFEYWGHEASLIPTSQHHLFRWKMEAASRGELWGGLGRLARERPDYVEAVFDEVAAAGPLSAGELSDPGRKSGPWWGWNHGKQALEYLFWCGRLTARRRGKNFEREYDIPERMIPPEHLAVATPTEEDARQQLLRIASRAMGVASAKDLADYHRQNVVKARPHIASLVEAGVLVAVDVEGWRDVGYLDPAARMPRRVDACALLSPFDSLVWERSRTERLFDFRYRIEIYTPAPKRLFGYYVLPFLLGEHLVARVDVKADRKGGALLVPGAFAEPGYPPDEIAPALAAELTEMARWLGLERVVVGSLGDLAPKLAMR